jgi:hypothetical protein
VKTIAIAEIASHAAHDNGEARIAPLDEPPLGGAVTDEPGALFVLGLVVDPATVVGAENVNGSELGVKEPGVLLAPEVLVDDADSDVDAGGGLVAEPEVEDESVELGGVGSSGFDDGFVGVGVCEDVCEVLPPVRMDDNGLFTILNWGLVFPESPNRTIM